ncbi:hypothetical protein Gotur_027057 [Gossypium turneri]
MCPAQVHWIEENVNGAHSVAGSGVEWGTMFRTLMRYTWKMWNEYIFENVTRPAAQVVRHCWVEASRYKKAFSTELNMQVGEGGFVWRLLSNEWITENTGCSRDEGCGYAVLGGELVWPLYFLLSCEPFSRV